MNESTLKNNNFCIYVHINEINGKMYIGQTCQDPPEHRWKEGRGYLGSTYFFYAILKYGWIHFKHIVLIENLTYEEANIIEEYLINKYKTFNPEYGYNLQLGGKNAPKTEEHKKKISESSIGKHPHEGELNPMYGKHMSEEAKQKSRLKQKGVLKVKCVETGEIFDSCHLAAAWAGLKRDGHIPEVCKGNRHTAGGYHWEKVED